MTIEKLLNSSIISRRSFNVCKSHRLRDLNEILEYYRDKKSFDKLQNCGRRSNEELTSLCIKYINFGENVFNASTCRSNDLVKAIKNLNNIQCEIIDNFIKKNFENLSQRSKNTLIQYLKGDLNIKNINDIILFNEDFRFQSLDKVGPKSSLELKNFTHLILSFVEDVLNIEDYKGLVITKNRLIIEKTFSISSIPNEILESQSIFNLVDFLISKNAIFGKNESIIFQEAFKIFDNQPELTLDEIAEKINISRERVRQILNGILENLFNNLQFLKTIEDDLYLKYGIDHNLNVINIDDDLNNQINEVNNTNFSIEFNTFIIYSYLSDKFDLVGEIEDVLLPKYFNSRDRHNWDNLYLVRQELTALFDFINFVDDIERRENDRIEDTYCFHFRSYLSNFTKGVNASITSLIFPVAEKIINQEFDLIIDLDDNIVFKRNTVKQVHEYAIEALEKLGLPSKIEDIYKLIELNYPEITKSQDALRGSIQRTSEIISFGRSGTYGLKKWEIEREGIKGGTIKDIILEYLQDKTEPIHNLELLNEVHKYRDMTNVRNIITNLKLDPQNQFIIFNQGFVGLRSKTYNSKLCNLPKFLGKNITNYIKQNDTINRLYVEEYFSKQLDINLENMKYIIEHLIDYNFIEVDNQNNLSI